MFLLSTIENRVRQNRKILFFCGRKNILKKNLKKFKFFQNRKKIEKMLKIFENFGLISKKIQHFF